MRLGLPRACSKIALLATLIAATAFAYVPESSVFNDWILDGDWAYGMMRPEAVAQGNAATVYWTGDGSNLVVVRSDRKGDDQALDMQEPAQTYISVWNRKSGKTRELMKVPGSPVYVGVLPIGGSSSVLVSVDESMRLVETNSLQMHALPAVDGSSVYPGVDASPSGNRFLVVYASGPRYAVAAPEGSAPASPPQGFARVYDLSGNVLVGAKVPVTMLASEWSQDGWPLFRKVRTRENMNPKGYMVLRPEGFVEYQGQPVSGLSQEPQPLRATLSRIGNGDSDVEIKSWWLDAREKGEHGHALICSDVEAAPLVSPTGDAVAYVYRGVPMVRRIVKMSKADFEKALMTATKQRAMNNAKQTVLGAIMYAGDSDDAFPLNGTFADGIEPYLKNRDISRDFTYTFGGGMLPKDANPAEFELGYIQTQYGQAVAYGDGHVVWHPNP